MEKEKFNIERMLGIGKDVVNVPTYEQVEASMVKAPHEGMTVIPSFDKEGKLICVDYKDNLSDEEALKNTLPSAVRMVSGRTQVIPGRAFITTMTAKRAKSILGHKFWESKLYEYYSERIFDEKRRLIEANGKTFEYDDNGRLSKICDFECRDKNNEPVIAVDIAYDKQNRLSHVVLEKERVGLYKYHDGEKFKRDISFAYDAEGGYVVTARCSVDGHNSQIYSEFHCNKQNDILLRLEKDSATDKVIFKKDYTKSEPPSRISIGKGICD